MTTTPDPITFRYSHATVAYEAIATEIQAFGFGAKVTDTGGGVLAVTVPLGEGRLLTFGGLQDGFSVVDVERDGESFTDGDGVPLTAAACIAAELVRRINCDDLPESPLEQRLGYGAYDALLQRGCEYVGEPDDPNSGVAGGQWAAGTYRLPDGRTVTVHNDGTATVEA